MLHVHLRPLAAATGLDYAACTRAVLDALSDFAPRAVLVPAFTYSFTKSGIFHLLYSKAETGRFAEEVRSHHARTRTPDPVFSVTDTTGWLDRQSGLRFDAAFEEGCIWERLLAEDCAIINLGIESLVLTQIHYLERLAGVPYRTWVTREGTVYHDDTSHEEVAYTYYARDMNQASLLDWPRIKTLLADSGRLIQGEAAGAKVAWIGARDMHSVLGEQLAADPYCLVHTSEMRGA
jgi:aminoglycoside 3-N-acetyltransferase